MSIEDKARKRMQRITLELREKAWTLSESYLRKLTIERSTLEELLGEE